MLRFAPEPSVRLRIIVADAKIEATDAQEQFTAASKWPVTRKTDRFAGGSMLFDSALQHRWI